ncbi:hypothetical protein [Marinomonas mediterranea]|nr:hypothetical protein [Marinomonas mediterranea]
MFNFDKNLFEVFGAGNATERDNNKSLADGRLCNPVADKTQ